MKKASASAQAVANSWPDIVVTLNIELHEMNRKLAITATARIVAMTMSAQIAEDVYRCASSRSSFPFASDSTLINALPASPKSVIDIQIRRLLIVSQTPYRSGPR
jgi:hypothetical protein